MSSIKNKVSVTGATGNTGGYALRSLQKEESGKALGLLKSPSLDNVGAGRSGEMVSTNARI